MLKIKSSVLRSGLVAAAVALLPLSEAAAQSLPWDPQTRVPPLAARDCLIPAGSGATVRIIAGPIANGNPDLSAPFPATVTNASDGNCPASVGTCLRWDYTWVYTGLNPSLALVTTDSAVKVWNARGPGGDSPSLIYPPNSTTPSVSANNYDTSIGWGNVGGELGMRFTANASTYTARVYTEQAAMVGPVTAGFKGGNRNGFCAIAGANKSSADPNLSFSKDLVTTTLGCEVRWNQSADGCVTGVSVIGGACVAIQNAGASGKTHLVNLHNASKSASCGTEINAPGSTNVCKYNSFLRTYTCVCVADANGGC